MSRRIGLIGVPSSAGAHWPGQEKALALACLEVFASNRRFAGLVVSEFNPDNADEEGEAAIALVQGLVDAVTGGISRSLGQATS